MMEEVVNKSKYSEAVSITGQVSYAQDTTQCFNRLSMKRKKGKSLQGVKLPTTTPAHLPTYCQTTCPDDNGLNLWNYKQVTPNKCFLYKSFVVMVSLHGQRNHKPEIGTRPDHVFVWSNIWTLVLSLMKAMGCFKHCLMAIVVGIWKTEMLRIIWISEGSLEVFYRSRILICGIDCSCDTLVTTMAAFSPCLKNLLEPKVRSKVRVLD